MVQSPALDLVNINMYAKSYKNITYGSRNRDGFKFSELDLGKTSTDDKWHFINPSVMSCQYQYVCKSLSKCSLWLKSYFQFSHLFRIRTSAKPQTMKNGIWQSFVIDLVNTNVYAKCYQNIPHGSRITGPASLI